MKMKFAFVAVLSTIIMGCTALTDFEKHPTANISNITFNNIDSQNTELIIDYCIKNNLPIDVELTSVNFDVYINSLVIANEEEDLTDIEIERNSQICRKHIINLDLTKNPEAQSTVKQKLLRKTLSANAMLKFDEEEVQSTITSYSQIIQPNKYSVITRKDLK